MIKQRKKLMIRQARKLMIKQRKKLMTRQVRKLMIKQRKKLMIKQKIMDKSRRMELRKEVVLQ